MTSAQDIPEDTVRSFYDALASDYDAMTEFDKRFVRERPFFGLLIDRHSIHTAIDAGSGTGFHSLLLARMGVQVTAVDVSEEMIAVLNRHSREMKVNIDTVASPLQEIERAVPHTVDAVFCLGNTLPHIFTREDLQKVLGGFFAKLKPQGTLFIQILNYDRILQQKERIQSVKEFNGTMFVRYYEYACDSILFHILRIRKNGSLEHSLDSVKLRPIVRDDLVGDLQKAGFSDIKLFGGISMGEYSAATSKDIVVLAHRP